MVFVSVPAGRLGGTGGQRRVGLTTAVVVAIGLGWVAKANAGDETKRVVVAPFAAEGDVPPHLLERVHQAVSEKAKAEGLEVIVPASGFAAKACGDGECARTLAADCKAEVVLVGRLVAEDRDVGVSLRLFEASPSAQTRGARAEVNQTCEICSHEELVAMAETLSLSLFSRIERQRPPAELFVTSQPSRSTVRIDGAMMGTTPLRVEVTPGAHVVAIEHAGFLGREERVDAVLGVREKVHAILRPAVVSAGPPIWAGVALLASGAAAVGGAAALLAIDGRPIERTCRGTDVDTDGDCRWLHHTKAGGAVLATGAIAAIAAGTAIFVIRKLKVRGSQGRARLVPSGGVLRF